MAGLRFGTNVPPSTAPSLVPKRVAFAPLKQAAHVGLVNRFPVRAQVGTRYDGSHFAGSMAAQAGRVPRLINPRGSSLR